MAARIFEYRKGPIFANLVLADEINRATPKTQSALLEAMAERTVSVEGKPLPLPSPFFVLATENPIEMEGVYPLPEAQLDRFLVKLIVKMPTLETLTKIGARAEEPGPPTAITTPEQLQLPAERRAVDPGRAARRGVCREDRPRDPRDARRALRRRSARDAGADGVRPRPGARRRAARRSRSTTSLRRRRPSFAIASASASKRKPKASPRTRSSRRSSKHDRGRADVDARRRVALLSPEIVARLSAACPSSRGSSRASGAPAAVARGASGPGIETIDLRPYAVGDDTRRIAWHAYARLEKLLIRLVADEAPLRLTLVVDQSASMGYGGSGEPNKLRQAARVAAGFAAVALGGEDRVAVAGVRPVSGRGACRASSRRSIASTPAGKTDIAASVRAAIQTAPGRSLCVIVSDFFEPHGVLAGAREARRFGHDVALVEVLAPFEIDPPDLDGMDLEDEETGELVELPETGTRDRFAEALAAHRASIDEAARTMDAAVVRTSTNEPFETIVTRALAAGVFAGSST